MYVVVEQIGISTKMPAMRQTIPEAIAILLPLLSCDTKLMNLLPAAPSRIPKTPMIMAMTMSTLAAFRSGLIDACISSYLWHGVGSTSEVVTQTFHKPSKNIRDTVTLDSKG